MSFSSPALVNRSTAASWRPASTFLARSRRRDLNRSVQVASVDFRRDMFDDERILPSVRCMSVPSES